MIFGKNIFINPGVGVKDFSIHYSRDIIYPCSFYDIDIFMCVPVLCVHAMPKVTQHAAPHAESTQRPAFEFGSDTLELLSEDLLHGLLHLFSSARAECRDAKRRDASQGCWEVEWT